MGRVFRFLKGEFCASVADLRGIRGRFFICIFNALPSLYCLRFFNNIFLYLAGVKLESLAFTYIKSGLHLDNAANVSIGKGCFINRGFFVEGTGRVSIGRNCQIGPKVSIFTTNHKFVDGARVDEVLSVTLGNNVWLGGGGAILPGAVISDNITIAAGSIVLGRTLKDGSLYAGNPAKLKR